MYKEGKILLLLYYRWGNWFLVYYKYLFIIYLIDNYFMLGIIYLLTNVIVYGFKEFVWGEMVLNS